MSDGGADNPARLPVDGLFDEAVHRLLVDEGIEFADGVQAMICKDARTMAERITSLAADPALIGALGANARAHVRDSFRTDVVFARLVTALCGAPRHYPNKQQPE